MDESLLLIDVDHHRPGDVAVGGGQAVSLPLQFLLDFLGDAAVDLQAARLDESLVAVRIRVEGILVVIRVEAGRGHRLFRKHAEFHVVQKHVQSGLILQVASRHADGDDRLAVPGDQGGRQGDPGPLSRLDAIGMAPGGVQAPEAVPSGDARRSGEVARQVAAGSGGHHVAPLVRHHAGRGVADGDPIRIVPGPHHPLERLHVVGISRPALQGRSIRIDQ